MKKLINNDRGFTLIEMMIVLFIITILLVITIPNLTKHNSTINKKGCDALKKMIEGQIQSFTIEHHRLPNDIEELISKGYLEEENKKCPDGTIIQIDSSGNVQ